MKLSDRAYYVGVILLVMSLPVPGYVGAAIAFSAAISFSVAAWLYHKETKNG